MQEERMTILKMVSDGKLSVEEAEKLLDSLGRSEAREEKIEINLEKDSGFQELRPSETNSARSIWDWLKILFSWGIQEKYEEVLDWELDSEMIKAITAETKNGSVKFIGSEQDRILITAKKAVKAPTREQAETFAHQVQIQVEQKGDRLHVYKEQSQLPHNVQVSISYKIQGPPALDLRCQSKNGSVSIEQAEGIIKAISKNGKVQLDGVSGQIQANTKNGSVKVNKVKLNDASEFDSKNGSIHIDVLEGIMPISATTINGSIHLCLPRNFSGKLDAATVNGSVRTEFQTDAPPMSKRPQNRLVCPIGEGGETPLTLRSKNGSIRLAMQEG